MGTIHSVVHDAIRGWYAGLIQHLWVSTLILATALVACGLLQRAAARTRHLILLLGVAKFVVPAAIIGAGLRWIGVDLAALFHPRSELQAMVRFVIPQVNVDGAVPTEGSEWLCAVTGLWLFGALVLGARALIARRSMSRSLLASASPASSRDCDAFDRVRSLLSIGRAPRLFRSVNVAAPAVLRIVRPLIFIPHSSDALTEREIEAVMAHELVHVKRSDNLVGTLQVLIGLILWFHPLVWFAQKRLIAERERACDEGVLDLIGGPESYVIGIDKLGRRSLGFEVAGISCMGRSNLAERMQSIMTYDTRKGRFVSHKLVLTLAVLMAIGLSAAGALLARANIGGNDEHPFRMKVRAVESSPGRFRISAEVFDAEGELLSSPTILMRGGSKAGASSEVGSLRVEIRVDLDDHGNGPVVLEIRDDRGLLDTQTAFVTARASGDTPASTSASDPLSDVETGERISIHLKNADLMDVLQTFSALSGIPIKADPPLHEKVTLDFDDVPWTKALTLILRQNDLAYSWSGEEIVVRRVSAAGMYRVGGNVRVPRVISRVDPVYPAEAKEGRIEGIVVLELVIDERGVVNDATALQGHPLLEQAAIDAVRQWRFEPATMEGKAVPVLFKVTINFRLDHGQGPGSSPSPGSN